MGGLILSPSIVIRSYVPFEWTFSMKSGPSQLGFNFFFFHQWSWGFKFMRTSVPFGELIYRSKNIFVFLSLDLFKGSDDVSSPWCKWLLMNGDCFRWLPYELPMILVHLAPFSRLHTVSYHNRLVANLWAVCEVLALIGELRIYQNVLHSWLRLSCDSRHVQGVYHQYRRFSTPLRMTNLVALFLISTFLAWLDENLPHSRKSMKGIHQSSMGSIAIWTRQTPSASGLGKASGRWPPLSYHYMADFSSRKEREAAMLASSSTLAL